MIRMAYDIDVAATGAGRHGDAADRRQSGHRQRPDLQPELVRRQMLAAARRRQLRTTNRDLETYASFYRVVVAVTWSDTVCASSHVRLHRDDAGQQCSVRPAVQLEPRRAAADGRQPGQPDQRQGRRRLAAARPRPVAPARSPGRHVGLPTGLTHESRSGLISGTPTALGTFSVTVSATDSFALIGTGAFTWTVVAPPVVNRGRRRPTRSASPPRYTAACTCTGTVTWAATGLPAGITINAATGTMSGTPTTANTTGTTVTVTATDAQGGSVIDDLHLDDQRRAVDHDARQPDEQCRHRHHRAAGGGTGGIGLVHLDRRPACRTGSASTRRARSPAHRPRRRPARTRSP